MTANASNSTNGRIGVGDKVGRYDVIEQVGVGGMSIVWKAQDKLLARNVALKQLMPASGDVAELRERFLAEVRIQKRVAGKHKFLVDTIEVIDEGDRGLFLAMEYIDGPSLEQVLASRPGPFDEQQALGIVAAIAAALQAIHAEGVLHRDLKPSNVLLPRDGGLKLTDFGLATLTEEQDVLTLGTVRYMAPEMFRGGDVDERADIYALGMIAYEMLAGREKFDDAFKLLTRDERNQGMRWMKWHTNPRVTAPPLSKINPAVSQTLSDLIARMMEKEPSARIASATDLLAAIKRHFIAGGEDPAEPKVDAAAVAQTAAASRNPTAALPQRSKWPLILTVVLLVQGLLLGGFLIKQRMDAGARAAEARNAAMQAYGQAVKSLNDGDYNLAEDRFASLAAEWPNDPVLDRAATARMYLAQALAHMQANNFEQAIAAYDRADDANALIGQTDAAIPRDYIDQRRRDAAKKAAFEQTLATIEAAMGRSDFVQARQLVKDAQQIAEVDAERQRLHEISTRLEGMQTRADVQRILAHAETLNQRGDRAAAMQLLEDATSQYRGPEMSAYLDTLRTRARFEQLMNEGEDAERAGDLLAAARKMEAADALLPSDELKTRIRSINAQYYYELGVSQLERGDVGAAQTSFTRSRVYVDSPQVRQRLASIETAATKAEYARRARTAEARGDYEEALQHYQDALAIESDAGLQRQAEHVRALIAIREGQLALDRGQLEPARDAFARALTLEPGSAEATRGMERVSSLDRYAELVREGDMRRDKGDYGNAKRKYLQARDVLNNPDIEERIKDAEYQQLISSARAYVADEQWQAARAQLISALQVHNTEEGQKLLAQIDSVLAGQR